VAPQHCNRRWRHSTVTVGGTTALQPLVATWMREISLREKITAASDELFLRTMRIAISKISKQMSRRSIHNCADKKSWKTVPDWIKKPAVQVAMW